MKKISIISLLVLCLWACTNDSENVNLQESSNSHSMKSGTGLQYFYDNMLASTEYSVWQTSLNEFVVRMGTVAGKEDFKDESQMLNWINNNISKTSFSNYNEAKTQWNAVKQKSTLVIANNPEFINGDWSDKDWDSLDIHMNGDYTVTTANDCTDDCIDDAIWSGVVEGIGYRAGLRAAGALAAQNAWAGAAALSLVIRAHNAAQQGINNTYKSCICACGPIYC